MGEPWYHFIQNPLNFTIDFCNESPKGKWKSSVIEWKEYSEREEGEWNTLKKVML